MGQCFSSAQWLCLPYCGLGQVPSCWSRWPECWVQIGSIAFKCVLSPPPSTGTLSPVESGLEKEELVMSLDMSLSIGFASMTRVRDLGCFWCGTCVSISTKCPCPAQMPLQVWDSFVPNSWSLPSASAVLSLMWNCTTVQVGSVWALSVGWGMGCGSPASDGDWYYFWCAFCISSSI